MADTAYLYAYFKSKGNWQDDQRVFFAVSRDGLHFHEVNGHQPLIESNLGTKGLRDPHLFRSRIDGRFCLLATDLDTSSQKWKEFSVNGSRSILVARSDDLVHWEKELVPVCGNEIGCVWAPKVCFDEKENRYMMYFSGSETTEVSMRVFYTTTKDFRTFTKPEILIDKYPNTEKKHYPYGLIYRRPQKYITHIDSTTIEVDGEFYRFTKNEALKIIQEDRATGNATVSERALREIYLKDFEICVRWADPMTVMSSYNCVNGIHTSSRYDLLTEVLRGEWGFQGLVMTDWGSRSTKPYDFHAGNDLIMGGYRSEFLMAALLGKVPEFAEDGYVRTQDFPIYGGFMTDHVEFWNSFELKKDGTDTVETIVAADVCLNPEVLKKEEEGLAKITDNPNGTKTVRYCGINRGKWLDIDDVRACACRVLTMIMNSISYDLSAGDRSL